LDIPSSLSDTAPANNPTGGDIVERLCAGDAAALARCISLMEMGGTAADRIHRRIVPRTGRAAVIGFTGAPGAGKSTLIDAMIARWPRAAISADCQRAFTASSMRWTRPAATS
jgi:putative protein kinase ArgK-like GTPase of G3E family